MEILRDLLLVPIAGPAATGFLSALSFALVVVFCAWLLVYRAPRAFVLSVWLAIGLLWAGLTAALEFGVFRWLLRIPWQTLLADYDPRHGYFGFVQLTLLLASAAWAAGRRSQR